MHVYKVSMHVLFQNLAKQLSSYEMMVIHYLSVQTYLSSFVFMF